MNSLSWLLYIADVTGSLRPVFGIASFLLFAFVIGLVIFHFVEEDREGVNRTLRRLLWIPILFAVIACLIPSTQTIYMIAASEAVEAVVTNPETVEIMTDLKDLIKKKLNEELGTK